MDEPLPSSLVQDIAEFLRLFDPRFDGFIDQSPDVYHHVDFSNCRDFERISKQLDKTEEAKEWYKQQRMKRWR